MKKLLIIAYVFIIGCGLPRYVFAYGPTDIFCVSGFDNDIRMDGEWSYGNSNFNTNQWHSEDGSMILQFGTDIDGPNINVLVDGAYGTAYYTTGGILGSWSVDTFGLSPTGFFVEGNCTTPPPPVTASTTATSTAAIYAFSALFLSMLTFTAYVGVMFLITLAVGLPLSYFCRRIFKIIRGPQI